MASRILATGTATRLLAGPALLNALREAGDRQFSVAYQPIVAERGHRSIWGAEALLRWQHPHFGRQSPHHFVPAMERSGMIHGVGEWILREACQQAALWRLYEPAFEMHVNVSPVQLFDPRFPDAVSKCLQNSGLAPGALVLEVTENMFIGDADGVLTQLRRLADLGVRLFIDDFGTGFASIAYIRRMPFSGIKVDRTFIQDLDGDVRGQAMLCWISNLARAFDLDVVAEGVETESEAALIKANGIDKLQGFLFSRALGAVDFARRHWPSPPHMSG